MYRKLSEYVGLSAGLLRNIERMEDSDLQRIAVWLHRRDLVFTVFSSPPPGWCVAL